MTSIHSHFDFSIPFIYLKTNTIVHLVFQRVLLLDMMNELIGVRKHFLAYPTQLLAIRHPIVIPVMLPSMHNEGLAVIEPHFTIFAVEDIVAYVVIARHYNSMLFFKVSVVIEVSFAYLTKHPAVAVELEDMCAQLCDVVQLFHADVAPTDFATLSVGGIVVESVYYEENLVAI